MANIFVVGSPYMNYTSALCNALLELGHNVEFYELEFFDRTKLNRIEYLKWRFNKKRYESKFYKANMIKFEKVLSKADIDVFIYFNGLIRFEYMNDSIHSLLVKKGVKSIVWYMDAIKHCNESNKMLQYYDEIYSFEESDVEHYKKLGIRVQHLPIGVDTKIYCNSLETKRKSKDWDICFVGNATPNRLKVLEEISKYAYENSLKMVVYGGYWTTRYKWKECLRKYQFKSKFPYLFMYVVNKNITPEEVAELYLNTKICLNIHTSIHNGCNPRTFEILGNGNFELCDFRGEFAKYGIKDGEHLAVYNNIEECISKINYYLGNDLERENIGNNGKNIVLKEYTVKELVKEKMGL